VKNNNIPSTDHVVHLCYGKGIENGQISPAAFLPRPTDVYFSVNWIEWLKCPDRSSAITEVRKRYAANFNNLKKKDKIALLNVGVTCSKVAMESVDQRCLKATHEPEPNDDSHSGLWGYTYNDMMIAEIILSSVLEDVPAIASP
jgi:hypothetical protein